jgi:hypothetical protein
LTKRKQISSRTPTVVGPYAVSLNITRCHATPYNVTQWPIMSGLEAQALSSMM